MLEILREKNIAKFMETYKNKELPEILRDTVEFNNYRSYFSIDSVGNIKTKEPSWALIKLTLLGNDCLEDYFKDGLFITEKRKIHKIDRLSNYDINHLEKNLYKIYYNRDLNISYRYTKEFILKDKELFIKKISNYVLLNNIDSKKSIITYAFIEALKFVDKQNIDYIILSYLPYIITYPSYIENNFFKGSNETVENYDLLELAYIKLMSYGLSENKDKYFQNLYNYNKSNKEIYDFKELCKKLEVGNI